MTVWLCKHKLRHSRLAWTVLWRLQLVHVVKLSLQLVGIYLFSELSRSETRSLFWQTTFSIPKAALLIFEVESV